MSQRTRLIAGTLCLVVSLVLGATAIGLGMDDQFAHAAFIEGLAVYLLVLGLWWWGP